MITAEGQVGPNGATGSEWASKAKLVGATRRNLNRERYNSPNRRLIPVKELYAGH